MSHDLKQRVKALERSLRRLRIALGVVLAGVAVLVAGAAFAGSETIKASRVEIISPKGDARVVLSQTVQGGEVVVYDATGAVIDRMPPKKKTE